MSTTRYEELLKDPTVVVVAVTGAELLTTAALSGEVTTTQSFLVTPAIPTRSFTTVAWSEAFAIPGAIKKSTWMVSVSSYKSKPVATSAVVSEPESTPPVRDLLIAADGLPKVVPEAAVPAFDIVERSPSQCANHT